MAKQKWETAGEPRRELGNAYSAISRPGKRQAGQFHWRHQAAEGSQFLAGRHWLAEALGLEGLTMTDADLLLLIKELQRTTPLGRLNLAECDAVFGRLKELGHDVTASTGLASGASEGTHPRYRAKANA